MRVLRRLTESDLEQAIALKIACWPEELAGVVEDTLDFDEEYSFWRDWMQGGEAFDDVRLLIGLFEKDCLLGTAFASFAETSDVASGGIELNGLWVDPGCRGEGISLQLLKYVVQFYKSLDKGYCKMVIYNHHFAPSNQYYLKLGAKLIKNVLQMDGLLKVDVFLLDFEEVESRKCHSEIYIVDGAEAYDLQVVRDALSHYNQSMVGDHLSKRFQFVYKMEGSVCGGCTGGIAWGWLFVDNIFVDPSYRKQGVGHLLLNEVYRFALANKVERISVTTIYDDVEVFFHKRGFATDGVLVDRPQGYRFRFMYKKLSGCEGDIVANIPVSQEGLVLNEAVLDEDLTAFYQSVEDDKLKNVGDVPFEAIGLVLKDCWGNCVGGLIGYIGWHWLYVSDLWVSDDVRGRGLGKALMLYLENYVTAKGVDKAFLGTTDFQAHDFYEHLGYKVFSVREELPPGHVNYSMMKALGTEV